jgi:hypothetical protein
MCFAISTFHAVWYRALASLIQPLQNGALEAIHKRHGCFSMISIDLIYFYGVRASVSGTNAYWCLLQEGITVLFLQLFFRQQIFSVSRHRQLFTVSNIHNMRQSDVFLHVTLTSSYS